MVQWSAIGLLSVACVVLVVWVMELRRLNARLKEELKAVTEKLEQAIRRLAEQQKEPKSKAFSRVVDLLVAAGVPGLILLAAMTVSGFAGAAAITTALAAIGGPAGMLGGIGFLVSLGVVLTQYSVYDLSRAVLKGLLAKRSKETLTKEIDSLPRIIPERFRIGAKSLLDEK